MGHLIEPGKYIIVISHGPEEYGYWDADRHLWVREIRHVDGRVERFTSRTLGGELTEEND